MGQRLQELVASWDALEAEATKRRTAGNSHARLTGNALKAMTDGLRQMERAYGMSIDFDACRDALQAAAEQVVACSSAGAQLNPESAATEA